MKKLLTILFILFFTHVRATIYYVSATGNDANNGTSTSTPFQTISKVNSLTLVADDQVLFNRGDTFYGTINVNQSGSSYTNTITYGAYGTGNAPIITGFKTLSSWTDNGGGVWYATIDSNNAMIATLNGTITYMGRTPYYYYQSHSGSNQITSSNLTGTPNWTGANIVMRNVAWIIDVMPITAQSGGTITFNKSAYTRGDLDSYNPVDGGWFFIQNDLRTLDSLGEWYNSGGKLYMYFGANSPTSYAVQGSTQKYNINLNSAYYIKIQDLDLEGASYAAINIKDNFGCTVNNVTSDKQGGYFMYGSMTNGAVTNSTLNNSLAGAFHVNAGGSNFRYLTLNNTALSPGNQFSGDGHGGGVSITGSNDTVMNCSIINSGYEGISLSGNNSFAQYNYVDNFGNTKSDVGGIYLSNSLYSNWKVDHNIVINGNSPTFDHNPSGNEGLYLDNGSSNGSAKNNTLAYMETAGLYMQVNGYNWTLDSNTIFGQGAQGGVRLTGQATVFGDSVYAHFANFRHNVVVSTSASSPVMSLEYYDNNQKDSMFNKADSNFYLRPISNDGSMIAMDSQYTTAAVNYNYTLSQWKSLSGKDANSVGSPKFITSPDSMRLVINPTMSDSTISLPYKYLSAKGTTYDGSITLAPFTSAVLIQNGTKTGAVAAPTISMSGTQSITVSSASIYAVPSWASGHSGTVLWTKVNGGSATITSPTSTSTTVTGLVNGDYTFRCTATQDDSQTVSGDVIVHVAISTQRPYIIFKIPHTFINVN